jgi:hypothetical protein
MISDAVGAGTVETVSVHLMANSTSPDKALTLRVLREEGVLEVSGFYG